MASPFFVETLFHILSIIQMQLNMFYASSLKTLTTTYQTITHQCRHSPLAIEVATAAKIATDFISTLTVDVALPAPRSVPNAIVNLVQSASMPNPTLPPGYTQVLTEAMTTSRVDALSTFMVFTLFILLSTILFLLIILLIVIIAGQIKIKLINPSLPLDLPTSYPHLSTSSTIVSTPNADHRDEPCSSPGLPPSALPALSELPLASSKERMFSMFRVIEKDFGQDESIDKVEFEKLMKAFKSFEQGLSSDGTEVVVDGQVSANVENVQDTSVEASPAPVVVSVITSEDASGSSHLLESAPSTLERSPFRAPTLLVNLAVPSVSVELEREVSTSVASTEIVLEETSVTDDLPESTSSILNQLPFYSFSPILSPVLVDAILQFSPNNTSIALETEDSNSVISTASVPGTSDFEVLFESTSSAVSSSPKSPVDQILPFALAEEISTNTAVLADSPVKEDSSDIDHRVIVADSDTLSSSPSTTFAAVTCKSPIDLGITKSKEDGTVVNESLCTLVLEVSSDLPGALLAAPEVSVLEDFEKKSIVADDSSILGTLTSAQTQELSASQSDDRTSGLLLAGPSQLLQVPIASPITTPILETSSKTSLPAILSDPPPKRQSRSSSFPPRRSSLPSSRQSRCLSSSGPYRSPFIAAVLPQSEFTFSAPVPDKALHAPVADCTVLDVSPPLKFSFSSFSSSSLSPETSFTFTFTPPSTATISASEGVVEVLDAPPSSLSTPPPIYTPPTSLPPFPPFHLSPSTSTINFSADPSASLDHLYAPSAPAPLSRRKSTRLQSRRAPILPYSSVANADAISTVSFFPAPSSLGYPLTVTTLEAIKSELGCPNSEEIKYVANIEAAPTMPESKTITNSPEIFRNSNIPSPIATGHPSVPRLRPAGERFNSGLVQPPSGVITQSLRAFCSSQSESEPVYNVSDHIHHVDNHTNTTEEPSTPSTSPSPSISISISPSPSISISTSPSPSISISTSLQPEVVFKTSNIEVTASSKSEATPLVNANTNDSPSTLPAQGEQATTQEPHNPRRPASRRVRKSKKSKKSKNSKK